MSNSRKNFQLKDIVNIQSSTRIFEKEYVEEGIPFYRSKEIIEKQKGNDVSTNLYISQERFNKIKQAYSVPRQGDILLTSVGTIGIPYMVRENEQFYFKDGNLTWFNNFSKEIDNKYFYYWILSEVGKEALNSILIGTTQKALTIKDLKSLEISLPPLSEQKRISSILSSFDNKIEQLKKQNNILEDIAQSIFKEWFVKYNFPNKDGKPYKDNNGKMINSELGLIPEGWRVGKLGEICELKSGFAFKGEDFVEKSNTKVIKIKNLQGKGNIDTSNLSHIKEDVVKVQRIKDFILSEGDILIAMSGNTTGKIGTMPYTDSPVYLNQRVGKLFFKNKDYHDYIYNFLMINNYEEKILDMGYGSAQPNINPSQIENIKILKPSTFLLDLYNQKTNIIYQKKRENIKDIIKLIKSKNILLNKLFQ